MGNGVRHVFGLLAGLIAAPVSVIGLCYGIGRMQRTFQYFFHPGSQWAPMVILAAVGVVLGALVGSRISPLASLLPGLLFGGAGALWALAPEWTLRDTAHRLPDALDRGYQIAGPYGVLLLVGLLLLVGSLPPSRWRPRESPTPARHTYGYGISDTDPTYGGGQGTSRPSVPQQGPSPQEGRPPAYHEHGPGFAGQGPAYGQDPRAPRPPGTDPGPHGGSAPGWASPPPGPPPSGRLDHNR
jgi:hypothetical protein